MMGKEPIRTASTLTIAIRPETRATLAALSALLQESMGRVVEKGLKALLNTLQPKDVEAVKTLAGRAMQKMETNPPEEKLADEIREFVFRRYIEPARKRGEHEVGIRVGEVHSQMRLLNRLPAVSAALRNLSAPKKHGLERLDMLGPANAARTVFVFKLV
jgi:hypothetical protein